MSGRRINGFGGRAGEYYRSKYGRGRGGGLGRGRGSDGAEHVISRKIQRTFSSRGTFPDLHNLLNQLDNKPYGAYHDLDGTSWDNEQASYTLFFGRAQSDPYAPPTRCRITLPPTTTRLPAAMYSNRVRRIASSDYLLRQLSRTVKTISADESLSGNGSTWNGPKGGDIRIMRPTQHVMEQSAVQVDQNGNCHVQLTVNLPARGRTILGQEAWRILNETLTQVLAKGVMYSSLDESDIKAHVDSIEDQAWLQSRLDDAGLIAFVKNGAVLPRRSGADDRPLQDGLIVPFQAPPSLEVSFQLPHSGQTITGLGVRKGITLICGGGFHGKTTLFQQALQHGVYWKIPGDGREFCVTVPNAAKIRAEDGRSVQSVDISSFIRNLPFGKDTVDFTTADASGSTSQASNIAEAVEAGSTALLMDEDSCATNFMVRDNKMMQLVAPAKEPIIPFVRLVRPLWEKKGISTVLVIGGAGDYFDIADHVLLMDCYNCTDATARAKEISARYSDDHVCQEACLLEANSRTRLMHKEKLQPNGKVKVNSKGSISYGDSHLELQAIEQIVCESQTYAIAAALQVLGSSASSEKIGLLDSVKALDALIDEGGLDVLSPNTYNGMFMRPRVLEICGAINRLRRDFITQQS